MATTPKLVELDPWLEGNTQDIIERTQRFQTQLKEIKAKHGSLEAFATGHKYAGIHYHQDSDVWSIREWAPAAQRVELIGDFNEWNGSEHALKPIIHGMWELILPGNSLKHKDLVKLRITGADGCINDRIPACITRVYQDKETHDFSAQIWKPKKKYKWKNSFDPSTIKTPLIYEAHVGMGGEKPRVHSYKEFANDVLPRIASLGYNIIQLMAVQEHPYYGSFGYHVSSFFACCSRFGKPQDLQYLIDKAHGMGIAVLLDIVHSHAVKNTAEGLNNFDGSGHQYFHAGSAGEHPQWDSKCFDYYKPEVTQFLLSNVRYWLEEFNFDGFRFDGITSMLYHHHGSTSFDHYDKYFRDGVDFAAVTYLQLATTLAKKLRPGAILIAEDMSGMPGLCRPIEEGGIGFTHRLAMGVPDYWIKLLKHKKDEDWNVKELWETLANRRHGEANIAYAESHDQALVGDKTLAFWLMDAEMYWNMSKDIKSHVIERGMALHKMIRLITAAAAGEGYLTFMGNEFGHPEWLDFPRAGNDWSFQHCRRQWSLVDNPDLRYHFLNDFDAGMIKLLKKNDILPDFSNTFLRSLHDDDKVLAFTRGNLTFIFNFNIEQSFVDYGVPVHEGGSYNIVLNTDAENFGGQGRIDESQPLSTEYCEETQQQRVKCYLPTRSAIVLEKKD